MGSTSGAQEWARYLETQGKKPEHPPTGGQSCQAICTEASELPGGRMCSGLVGQLSCCGVHQQPRVISIILHADMVEIM